MTSHAATSIQTPPPFPGGPGGPDAEPVAGRIGRTDLIFGPVQQIQWLAYITREGILAALSPSAAKTMCVLMTHASNKTGRTSGHATRSRIMRECAIASRATHARLKRELIDADLIEDASCKSSPNCVRFRTIEEIIERRRQQAESASMPLFAKEAPPESDEFEEDVGPEDAESAVHSSEPRGSIGAHRPVHSSEPPGSIGAHRMDHLLSSSLTSSHPPLGPRAENALPPTSAAKRDGRYRDGVRRCAAEVGLGPVTVEDLQSPRTLLTLLERAQNLGWINRSGDDAVEFFVAAAGSLRLHAKKKHDRKTGQLVPVIANPSGRFIATVSKRRWARNTETDRDRGNAMLKSAVYGKRRA